MTRLRASGASDTGQVRSNNQDSVLVGDTFAVVADGMGGHQGGEVASAIAIDAFDGIGDVTTVDELVDRFRSANDAVLERASQDPDLAGMGTTLVAIALVHEDGEDRIAVLNVGDSRAYRLANGALEQVSDDHSLVGEMVRDGRLTAEQARDHPRKNIVTRAIGIDPDVDVDDFQLLPHTGDRYLLCSDGLTDEVEDAYIAAVLRTTDDPDAAVAELVRMANDHGGRDNISVVVVDVTDDGGLSAAASAAVPDADGFRHESDEDTETYLAVPDDRDPVLPTATDVAETPKRRRAVTPLSALFVVVVAGVIGGALWLANDYARNTYHLDVVDDEVVIVQGRPGGWLWFDTELVERTEIDADDVPAEFADEVESNEAFSTLASARTFVRNVEERIDELEPPPTTTSTTSTTTTTAAPRSTTTSPTGN